MLGFATLLIFNAAVILVYLAFQLPEKPKEVIEIKESSNYRVSADLTYETVAFKAGPNGYDTFNIARKLSPNRYEITIPVTGKYTINDLSINGAMEYFDLMAGDRVEGQICDLRRRN